MRRWICVPMITLCLLLSGCTTAKEETETLRERYQTMSGCDMEAEIICRQNDREWTAVLRCAYVPEGECRVEVLEPETISGICAVISDGDWRLEYEDVCLDIGALGSEDIHPATALPRLWDVFPSFTVILLQ